MEVFRNNGALRISEIDPFLAELLRQIPVSANPEAVPAAEQRLYSAPAGPNEKALCAEWAFIFGGLLFLEYAFIRDWINFNWLKNFLVWLQKYF